MKILLICKTNYMNLSKEKPNKTSEGGMHLVKMDRDQLLKRGKRGLLAGITFVYIILFSVFGIVVIEANVEPSTNITVTTFEGKDASYILSRPQTILVPLNGYTTPVEIQITVEIIPKSDNSITIDKIFLSTNSKSVLSYDGIMEKKDAGSVFSENISISHNFETKQFEETHLITVLYFDENSNFQTEEMSLSWEITMMDINKLSYLGIILLGVLMSKVFFILRTKSNVSEETPEHWFVDKKDFLLIPFSAIITLLLYSSFTDQVSLGSDIIKNFSLAFGFGLGFDSVLRLSK